MLSSRGALGDEFTAGPGAGAAAAVERSAATSAMVFVVKYILIVGSGLAKKIDLVVGTGFCLLK